MSSDITKSALDDTHGVEYGIGFGVTTQKRTTYEPREGGLFKRVITWHATVHNNSRRRYKTLAEATDEKLEVAVRKAVDAYLEWRLR